MINRLLIWATPSRVNTITPADAPKNVGAKAAGLLWLPPAWVPPFFVLSPDFHEQFVNDSARSKADLIASWQPLLEHALRAADLESAERLYIRSNGIRETLAERGRYPSIPCVRKNWLASLQTFFERVSLIDSQERLGVVVQKYVDPLVSGHLSNARRVVREYRDAVIESTDQRTGQMAEAPLSFRRWRRQKEATADALACKRSDDIPTALREPLAHAAAQKRRVQYEWLWDGAFVYVVQADPAPEPQGGVSPAALTEGSSQSSWSEPLRRFRLAAEDDAQRSRKLRSHFLYASHGFNQPPLYLLEGQDIGDLLHGTVSSELESDLTALTARPLVIRTSSSGSGTLLPRSDLLHTAREAADWLTGPWAAEIRRRDLAPSELSLIAHHFIPAQAAAFSTGSPDGRFVYIEALWGIPEGLYYYPCDFYLVDTQTPLAANLEPQSVNRFHVQDDVRFKGQFVAPNESGRFVVQATKPPWDWKATIEDEAIVRRIALFTRQLAALEGKRVKLMWFLGCADWAGLPPTIPWYHDFEADDWTTADSHERNSRDETFPLRTEADLIELESRARRGYTPANARRLIVAIDPVEDRLIRSEVVAERIGKAAKALGAVVELRGGVLSHVYYSLRRAGADVSVRARPRFAVRPAEFHKLVRDKIPAVVAAGGEQAKISRLAPEELGTALKIKLVEEAFEARDAAPAELIHEIADVLDVVDALIRASGISRDELSKVRRSKRQRRGGFKEGVVLVETSLPIEERPPTSDVSTILPMRDQQSRVVETNQSIQLEMTAPGPFDIREGEDFVEYVHTIVTGLTHREWRSTSPGKIRVGTKAPPDSVEWIVEGKREGGQMKLRLKIRLGSGQLRLPLDESPRR